MNTTLHALQQKLIDNFTVEELTMLLQLSQETLFVYDVIEIVKNAQPPSLND